MKKLLAVAGSVLVLGLLVGCEDKQAEAQQNEKIQANSSELNRMRSDIEAIQSENVQLKSKINLVTDWLRKKVEEEKAKALAAKPAPKVEVKGAKPGAPSGAKTADPKKKMFP
ncbi:MAG TPA: hypothetical protein DET40_20455 [Lentisphaeria bacterium]|nr:MAG: hypothetical protein A2X45_16310 [Lentisphaerae bacterium GWF2_50_93]HCE45924.1 hypothetical protein [Lentisphaeria bacterium]